MREKQLLERVELIRTAINALEIKSAYKEIIRIYALELLKELEERIRDGIVEDFLDSTTHLRRNLLNGAKDWEEYSRGGCSLIYDDDIRFRCQYSKANYDIDPLKEQAKYLKSACSLIERINHQFF